MTEEELQQMASQLGCPTGKKGIETGELLNSTNKGMTKETVRALSIKSNNVVLELGHGNCGHLPEILKQAENITFCGLEISETMRNEAIRINEKIMSQHQIEFGLYDGANIPYPDDSFDRILSVNTLYFWPQPEALLHEIYRVLRPGGLLALTFGKKKFMKDLPFVKYNFRLYDNQDMADLARNSSFDLRKIIDMSEEVKSKTGELVTRIYSIALLGKGDLDH